MTLSGRCSSLVARICARISPQLARRYATWYRIQTIRYPNSLGSITWRQMVRMSHGLRFHAEFREAIGMNLILEGIHEPEITRRIADVLKPGDAFIDVGANL